MSVPWSASHWPRASMPGKARQGSEHEDREQDGELDAARPDPGRLRHAPATGSTRRPRAGALRPFGAAGPEGLRREVGERAPGAEVAEALRC